jgi:predicted YcjX-like family ATPase
MSIRDFNRQVAVVGLGAAGKTVFLTSLLDHLHNHDPAKLKLTPVRRSRLERWLIGPAAGVEITNTELLPPRAGLPAFNYKAFRTRLAEAAEWPRKTVDTGEIACRFQRSDWTRGITLRFLDFPGERIADACMGTPYYGVWSDRVLGALEAFPEYRELASDYFELQGCGVLDPDAVVTEYKRVLGRMIKAYKPFITPSVFLLDPQGAGPDPAGTVEQWAAHRLAGLRPGAEFAPLSAEARRRQPALAERWAAHYREYRRAIPARLFARLARSHRLIVLVDIPGTLAACTGRYNDTTEVIADLLQICLPRRNPLAKTWDKVAKLLLPSAWRPTGISRVAFVATKADLVRPADVSRLRGLLREMIYKTARNYAAVQEYYTCAAVVSTTATTNAGRPDLAGYPVYDPQGRKRAPPRRGDPLLALNVSAVPAAWPDDWREGDFCFPDVYPVLPRKNNEPPAQEGLGDVLDFILAEQFWE